MNLRNIANAVTSSVNPNKRLTIFVSTGYVMDGTGRQVPQYHNVYAMGDRQSLSGSDIKRLEGLGIQGVTCKLYLNGNYEGMFRVLGKGGDLILIDGKTYLVTLVMERWADWCCLALTMQTDT
jgi:hypothetical protein